MLSVELPTSTLAAMMLTINPPVATVSIRPLWMGAGARNRDTASHRIHAEIISSVAPLRKAARISHRR